MCGDPLDPYLRIVADRTRRMLLRELRYQANEEVRIGDLVDQLQEEGPTENPNRGRDKLAIKLYHDHLPKLTEHGVVEYRPEEGTIKYKPNEQLEGVLDSLPDEMSVAKP